VLRGQELGYNWLHLNLFTAFQTPCCKEHDMSPEHDRRQSRPAETSETAGWHSLEFIVRQALEVQRDIGTDSAVEFLQSININPQVIERVLAPNAKLREADQVALASSVTVSDLPISTPVNYLRRSTT
jgi:hypothetical protein